MCACAVHVTKTGIGTPPTMGTRDVSVSISYPFAAVVTPVTIHVPFFALTPYLRIGIPDFHLVDSPPLLLFQCIRHRDIHVIPYCRCVLPNKYGARLNLGLGRDDKYQTKFSRVIFFCLPVWRNCVCRRRGTESLCACASSPPFRRRAATTASQRNVDLERSAHYRYSKAAFGCTASVADRLTLHERLTKPGTERNMSTNNLKVTTGTFFDYHH